MDSRELSSLGKQDGQSPIVVGNDVYDPLTFAPEIIRFTRKQYIFLNAYKLGVPMDQACARAEMTPNQAERFLSRSQTIEWLRDRALMNHIKTEWEEPAKWWSLGNEVLEGRREFSKAQTVVFQEFGSRIVPKRSEAGNMTKIEINISPDAVRQATLRQAAIDGELA